MKKKNGAAKGSPSIKRRLTGAVLIPSVTLILLWVGFAGYLLIDGYYGSAIAIGVRSMSIPAVSGLASVQKERQLSMAFLSQSSTGLAALHRQEQQSDQGLAAMKNAAGPILAGAPAQVAAQYQTLSTYLDQLPVIRSEVDAETINKGTVYTFYNNLLDSAANLFDTQARITPDITAMQGGISAATLFRAADMMSRADSLIAGAFSSGGLSPSDHLAFSGLVGAYHSQLDTDVPYLRPEVQADYRNLAASDSWTKLVAAENTIIERGAWVDGKAPIAESTWQSLTDQMSTQLINLTIKQADLVSAQAVSDGNTKLVEVILGSVAALLVVAGSIYAALRISRTLVDRALVARLGGLRNDVLQLARRRLPDIVARLREGETVDVKAELPDLNYGTDEIGEVAEAFNAAQYEAVSAAVKEAQARDGVHNVFLGIAHRHQGLVHRQLKLLDTMEREEESAEQLDRLFQLDHLATRARRNAENLIILGGEQPGRRWRNPIPLLDVVRAAVSETEQYARVQVERVPEVTILGSAVADTIHLIAELVDNATAFSPPRSQVHVNSALVAKGVVVEVEDQGLGMSDEDRDRANSMMADPPEFDAMALKGDSRLGHFVIARLAARLGIRVEFRPSPYGGTRAIVLIPSHVLGAGSDSDGSDAGYDRSPRSLPKRRQHSAVDQRGPVRVAGAEDDTWVAERTLLSTIVDIRSEDFSVNGVANGTVGEREVQHDSGRINGQHTRQPAPATDDPVNTGMGRDTEQPTGSEVTEPRLKLPQRKPQQNLAPQLRDDQNNGWQEPDQQVDDSRSAEQVRDAMSAFQKGSVEGRRAGDPADS